MHINKKILLKLERQIDKQTNLVNYRVVAKRKIIPLSQTVDAY